MRKEYNNRCDAPIVNPGFTIDANGVKREIGTGKPLESWPNESNGVSAMAGDDYEPLTAKKLQGLFIPLIHGRESEAS